MVIKKNLDSIIYDKMIECLISGEFQMGQQILLDDLVEKFSVSRTPISQAARLLNTDGILELKPNGRLYVPSYDKEQIRQIVNVRLLIEKYAIEQADFNKNSNIFEELKNSATLFKKYAESEFLKMAKEDLNFHRLIVDAASNEYLSDIYRRVQGRYIIASYLVLPPNMRDNNRTASDHFQLLEYLETNNVEGAKKLLEEHINAVCDQMLNRY